MTDPIKIKYQTARFPVAIDGPCPFCGIRFQRGDSITLGYPIRHRHCDPIATYIDHALTRDLETIAALLDKDMGA